MNEKFRDVQFWFFISIICVLSFLLIFFTTKNYGVGVSPDSVVYFEVAKQIMHGETVYVAMWPPLFPAILAVLASIFDLELLHSARILNAILFSGLIFTSGMLFHRHKNKHTMVLVLFLMSITVSIPLVPIFLMAWSEPPYLLFSLLFIFFMDRYYQQKKPGDLILAASFAALGSLTRYMGVANIISGCIILVIAHRHHLTQMIQKLITFGLVSMIPMATWLARNKIITGTLVGWRYPSSYTFLENIQAMGNLIFSWYFPEKKDIIFLVVAGLYLFAGVIVCIYFVKSSREGRKDFSWQWPFILFLFTSVIFLVASSKSYEQLIDNRLLSPILIPFNLLAISWITDPLNAIRGKATQFIRNLLALMTLLLLVVIPLPRTKSTINSHMNQGYGFTNKWWTESETLAYLENNVLDCTIYSNGADVVEFWSEVKVKYLPFKYDSIIDKATVITTREEWASEKNICIAWFNDLAWRNNFSPLEILNHSEIDEEFTMADGSIYFIMEINP